MRIEPVFLFDLDGTLVDSVYQHVLAWKEALDAEGIELSVWRIHRKIGMSGGLFTNQLLRETGLRHQRRAGRAPAPAACRSLSAACRPHSPAARRARAAGVADGRRHPLGDRHQRAHGDGRASISPRSASIRPNAGRDARSGANTPSPIPICSWPPRPVERADRHCGGGRRQHLGHAGGSALPRARGRAAHAAVMAASELQQAGALPRLRGPGGSAASISTRSADGDRILVHPPLAWIRHSRG